MGATDEADPDIAGEDAHLRDQLALVTHELKAPLSSIMGSLDVIESGTVGEVSAAMAPMIEMARRNAQKMLSLIDDILEEQMLSEGKLTLCAEPLDLAEFIPRVVALTEGLAEARQIAVEQTVPDAPARVMADPKRLDQVLTNLISNAVKFSNPGQRVNVVLSMARGVARISVEDCGVGVPDAFRDKVFDRFAKMDFEDKRNLEGNGLGLAIARRLVEAQSGRIGFSSVPGSTAFWVELPLIDD